MNDQHAVTDVHAHVVPEALLTRLRTGELRLPHVELVEDADGTRFAFEGISTRPIARGLTDLAQRFTWMSENGIDVQWVGGWLDIFGYELEVGEGADWAAAVNAALVELTTDPRLVALATVPMQDPRAAGRMLGELKHAGLPGVMIATHVQGSELDSPEFEPFWEAAHDNGSVVFIHPGFGKASRRYQAYGLLNGLSRLEDTTVTLARLLYAGVPERYHQARIVVAHGGASLPFVLGRLLRNHALQPTTTHDPLLSLRHLYFDSVVFDPAALGLLLHATSDRQVLLGSDYPFPIGDLSPREVLSELDFAERSLVESGNAERLVGGPAQGGTP